jgi:hypothetical protein
MKRILTFSLMVCLGVAAVHAADRPQWQGPPDNITGDASRPAGTV